jgi:hypothetical protein
VFLSDVRKISVWLSKFRLDKKRRKKRFMNGGSWKKMMDAMNLEWRTKTFFTGARGGS